MLPNDISIATGTTLRRVMKDEEKVMYKGAKWRDGEHLRSINILVKAYNIDEFTSDNFLIIFQEEKTEQNALTIIKDLPINEKTKLSIAALEDELQETKENLQTTIEQVETSNEELQATNQELLSSNEELQSTNEELQSVNEELHTVNSEHQLKIEELANINHDMNNLMNSTEIGTIFLDKALRIRKFTPNIIRQFNLQETDTGRSITDFSSKFGHNNSEKFKEAIFNVAKTGKSDQRELQTNDGTWYLQRIFPFIESNNKFNGVVITFVNTMNLKKAYEEVDNLAKELVKKVNELEVSNITLSRFNKAAVGRENRMIELKQMVNNLQKRLGEKPKFDLTFKEVAD